MQVSRQIDIQTHLSPDREESGEDPVEENVTRQLLFSLLSVLYVFSVFSYVVSVFLLLLICELRDCC